MDSEDDQTHEQSEPPSPPPGSAPDDVKYVLDALRWSADEELTMAERLSVKARQAFVLGVGFFTIVQTVAFNSFAQRSITPHEKHWLLGLAIGAILALAVAAYTTVRAELLIPAKDLLTGSRLEASLERERSKRRARGTPVARVAALFGWRIQGLQTKPEESAELPLQPALPLLEALNGVYSKDGTVAGKLASAYVTIVDYRRGSNDKRRDRYRRTRQMVALAIVVTTAELIFALIARLGPNPPPLPTT